MKALYTGLVLLFALISAALAQTAPDLKNPDTIPAGRQVFEEKQCTYCHGPGGNGAIKLAGRSDLAADYVFSTIAEGRTHGSRRMPSWRGVLTDEQIWQATAYVLSLAQQPK